MNNIACNLLPQFYYSFFQLLNYSGAQLELHVQNFNSSLHSSSSCGPNSSLFFIA